MKLEEFWDHVVKTDNCWEWQSRSGGYGRVYISGKHERKTAAHRLSWELANGPIPEGMFIDHICRNHACVRPDHLRLATPKQNLEHLAEIRANNTSGYRGVCWNKVSGFWQATVVHNYERHFLGFFDTAEEAGAAAQAKRLELYTHNEIDRDPEKRMVYTGRHRYRCGAATAEGSPCRRRVHNETERCAMHRVTQRGNARPEES